MTGDGLTWFRGHKSLPHFSKGTSLAQRSADGASCFSCVIFYMTHPARQKPSVEFNLPKAGSFWLAKVEIFLKGEPETTPILSVFPFLLFCSWPLLPSSQASTEKQNKTMKRMEISSILGDEKKKLVLWRKQMIAPGAWDFCYHLISKRVCLPSQAQMLLRALSSSLITTLSRQSLIFGLTEVALCRVWMKKEKYQVSCEDVLFMRNTVKAALCEVRTGSHRAH